MDGLKQQLQLQLTANILKNICAANGELVFSESRCSQERIIRFTSKRLRELFLYDGKAGGKWQTGDAAMYEVQNKIDVLEITCIADLSGAMAKQREFAAKLISFAEIQSGKKTEVRLKTWVLKADGGDANELIGKFENFVACQRKSFENALADCLMQPNSTFEEGDERDILSNKYERSAAARKACIAAHGPICRVCGFDFGKAYGNDFAGIIEVHHILPLSEIGERYIVDPVKDLVPVCANCHTALHSKQGGIYTVEELKSKLRRLKKC